MLVDSLWCNGRERRRQTSCLMLDSMRIGSLTPVSLGNERIPCDFSRVLVQPILKKIIILSILFSDWFSIHGFIWESKWFFDFYACFCVFLCIISYFYAFIFIFMHCYAFFIIRCIRSVFFLLTILGKFN